jgi:fermentation-respiration switch protein FrsA (DUF1100 family)
MTRLLRLVIRAAWRIKGIQPIDQGVAHAVEENTIQSQTQQPYFKKIRNLTSEGEKLTANAFLKPAGWTATPVESAGSANARKMLAALIVVAAVASIIAFGSLMGAMFIGQQFLQNVPD